MFSAEPKCLLFLGSASSGSRSCPVPYVQLTEKKRARVMCHRCLAQGTIAIWAKQCVHNSTRPYSVPPGLWPGALCVCNMSHAANAFWPELASCTPYLVPWGPQPGEDNTILQVTAYAALLCVQLMCIHLSNCLRAVDLFPEGITLWSTCHIITVGHRHSQRMTQRLCPWWNSHCSHSYCLPSCPRLCLLALGVKTLFCPAPWSLLVKVDEPQARRGHILIFIAAARTVLNFVFLAP